MSHSTAVEITANERIFEEACQVIPGGVNTSLRRFEPRLAVTRAQGAVITSSGITIRSSTRG
jgi:glutamate-1-semialdehyde aminotransferase